MYAGIVTNPNNFHALAAYAVDHAIPILAIVGKALLPEEAQARCVEWPVPASTVGPSACLSADYMRNLGTPGMRYGGITTSTLGRKRARALSAISPIGSSSGPCSSTITHILLITPSGAQIARRCDYTLPVNCALDLPLHGGAPLVLE